jgi:hypothetical protein
MPQSCEDGLEIPWFLDRQNWRDNLPPPLTPEIGRPTTPPQPVTPESQATSWEASGLNIQTNPPEPALPPLAPVLKPSPTDDDWRPIVPVPDDAPPPDTRLPGLGRATQIWTYRDAAGKLLGYVCRFDLPDGGKEIRPLTWGSVGSGPPHWAWKQFAAPRPLYNCDQLAIRHSSPVLVVEGEKTADAAGRLFPDHVATTSPSGANAAHLANFTLLKGRNVVIWPDADAAGAKYASTFAEGARAAGTAQVTIVQLPDGLPESWDLADPLPAGRSANQLRALLDQPAPAAHQSLDDDTELDRLAKLSGLQYERERERAAKQLGVRQGQLDKEVYARRPKGRDPGKRGQGRPLHIESSDPWPEPVDGVALLNGIAETIRAHVVLSPEAAAAAALWCLHTYALDAAQHSPRLAITSPEKRCGKTTLLAVLRHLVDKPLSAEVITAAAMYRVVEAACPTVLVDEADTFIRDSEELRAIINSGHRPDGRVWKTVGDDHEPRGFSTFSPVAIACIRELPGTITDRSIAISLRRRYREEPVDRFRDDRANALDILACQAARWAADHLAELRSADPEVPPALHDRAADNWRPLLAIADAVGGEWPDRVRQAALAISLASDATDNDSVGAMLLEDMRTIFEARGTDRLPSNELVAALSDREDRPWPEFKGGKPITPRQIARLLAPFGISPTNIKIGGHVPKGYQLEDCQDAFDRYLSPAQSATPLPL